MPSKNHKTTRSTFKQIRIEKYITPLASSIFTNGSRVWPVNHLYHRTTENLLETPPKKQSRKKKILTRKSNSKIQLEDPTRNPTRNPNSVNSNLFFYISYLFAADVDLLLGLLPVQEFPRKLTSPAFEQALTKV